MDTVTLTCTENEQTILGEVLEYRRGYSLTCSLERQVRLFMRYNDGTKKYTGRVGSLEFTTNGPK